MTSTALPATRQIPARIVSPSRIVSKVASIVAIVVLLVIEIYPLFWLIMSSFKTQDEFLNAPAWALPSGFDWSNYFDALVTANIGKNILNSVIATAPSLALIILFGTAAGFALEVLVFRGRGAILLTFLAGIMIPGQMILLPLFNAYFQIGITGTLWPLIITYTATGMPLTVFMMATYFRAVPREIFEAAAIDGASMLRSFFSIGFPMVRNAVFTVALVQFFFIWNDLLIAITFTSSSDTATVQVGLLNFSGQYGATQFGPLLAAICVNVVGILIIYLFLNQRIMRGLAAGSVKG
ncbi:carbohydrate ABC transporter permease [Lacisediminihabitans changchengi]|uniref:Carbohydrate ABC transporter permease n=1 Tax=Lacisediminihabitans changchengi TaxID=2787634 RepID=A0A934SQF8_9MICO|nr:carbohydrate ABC transporter permease [Lacisediminihabitans changchengi]MBK4347105.1 carbohydrate ABC transporter permease [Lacisediminihabitans changchengi]